MNNRGFAPVVLIIVVAALLAIGIGGYVFLQQKDNTPPPTVEEAPVITLPPVVPTSNNSVEFSVSPTSGPAPLRVTFASQNLSGQHRYGINYGDDGGGPGMMEKKCIEHWPVECGDPNGLSHRYVSPGTYTAQLNEYQCSGNWGLPQDGGWTCNGTVERKVIGTATVTASGETKWKTYNGSNYSFEYPANFQIEATSPTGVNLSHLRPDRVFKPIDCGGFLKAPDEIGIFIGVITSATQSYYAELYASSDSKDEFIGGKKVRAQRNIPGMCEPSDYILWEAPNGSLVVFGISPSYTELVSEYVRVIETFHFGT